MPAVDLRDVLRDIAGDVHDVELMSRLRPRRRIAHRTLLFAACAAAVAGAAGAAALAMHTREARTADSLTSTQPPRPAGTTRATPNWLPDGVSLHSFTELASPTSSAGSEKPSYRAVYSIAGRANADTLPTGGVQASNATDLSQHPATVIESMFNPNLRVLPSLNLDTRFFASREVIVGAFTATVTTPRNGYGAHRVDWIDPEGYHTLVCDRLRTDDGTSGVDDDALLRMARNLYS